MTHLERYRLQEWFERNFEHLKEEKYNEVLGVYERMINDGHSPEAIEDFIVRTNDNEE